MAKTENKSKIVDLDEQPDDKQAGDTLVSGRSRQSRLEKKSRKTVSRLGLEYIPDVVRISIKKSKHVLFNIVNPDVYKCPNSDKYIIFGDAQIEDVGNQNKVYLPQSSNAVADVATDVTSATTATEKPSAAGAKSESLTEAKLSIGLDEGDIDLVMKQCNVSREKAIEALKLNDNDLVETILQLK